MLPISAMMPRSTLSLHSRQLRFQGLFRRHASTAPPKPRLLEKPERFNPPSHPARIKAKPKYYGPGLSEAERQAQRTRSYPNMMPAEGTLMHSFLTNRTLHTIIPIGILLSITFGIWYQEFIHNTPYLDLLPPNSMLFAHPITFFSRWFEVYAMHVQYVSEKTAERRKQKVEDVKKRSEYRKAHGLEDSGELGNWTAKPDVLSSQVQEEDDASPIAQNPDGKHLDHDGSVQPNRKRFLGIW